MEPKWRKSNHFTLLPGVDRYLPELLTAIDEAEHSALFEQYLIESGRLANKFIDSLICAANRGVVVRVLLDSYGAHGLKDSDIKRLRGAGVSLRFYNPFSLSRLKINLARDHRKLLLVDGYVAFTGGFCITDSFLDKWYDLAVRIEGPVVMDWIALFSRLWASPSCQGRGEGSLTFDAVGETVAATCSQEMRGRLIWGRGRNEQAIRFSLQQRIRNARGRVWVYTPYFLPTMSLRRRLEVAARRGLDVRLLVAGEKHDHPSVRFTGQSYYGRLLQAGVRIYEYQPSFTHAKFCVVDNWCTLGSCNFDHWSLRWNLEANQEVDNALFAADVAALFETHAVASDEIHLEAWLRRPWWKRLRERLLGTLNAFIAVLH
jgi:phosphatidylserine/phosphatidylglycerophosphate/cardiolipin synthase-like enzyme